MIDIIMTFKHIKTDKSFIVRYDPNKYDHDIWEHGTYLGRIRLRELFFAGFECTDREFNLS